MKKPTASSGCPGKIRVICLCLLLFGLTGCASIIDLPYYRDYQGAALPGDSVAYVTHESPYSQEILVREVDGIETFWVLGAMEFRPGRHSITCTYCSARHNTIHRSGHPVTFPFDVQAGRIYVMKVEESVDMEAGRTWRLRLLDVTDFNGTGRYSAAFDEIANYKRKVREGKALSAIRGSADTPVPMQ